MKKTFLVLLGLLLPLVLPGDIGPPQPGASRPKRPKAPRVLRTPDEGVRFWGRPVSYWRQRARHGDFTFTGWSGSLLIMNQSPPWWLRGPAWATKALELLGVNTDWSARVFLSPGDPASGEVVPLLLEMFHDGDPYVREIAVRGLGRYGGGPWEAKAAVALVEALDDPDAGVRAWAAWYLELGGFVRGKHAAEVVPALVEALEDPEEDVRWWAAWSLRSVRLGLSLEEERAAAAIRRREGGRTPSSLVLPVTTDADMLPVRDCWATQRLIVSGPGVTDAGLVNLIPLRELWSLSLAGTRVTDAGLVHLQGMRKLGYLDLSRTAVGDRGLAHLQGLRDLGVVDLTGTAVTVEGVKELQKVLPKVRVVR
jgi:hypothetical protein